MTKRLFDLVIVGAGPAGLSAGIFANEMKLKTLLLEAEEPGGQLVSLYPFKLVSDYPGFPPCPAGELAARVVDHAQKMGCRILTKRRVTEIISQKESFLVKTSQSEYLARAVIVSIGLGVFSPRKLNIPGEKKFAGKGVFHKPQRPDLVKSKKVLVVGGGDTAFETANQLAGDNQVTLIHRTDQFRALEVNLQEARQKKIKILVNHELKALLGTKQLAEAQLVNNQTGKQTKIKIDKVFILIGFEMERALFDKWGLKTKNQAVKVDRLMQTDRPGVFACGDVAVPAGEYKRILVAEAQAAKAVHGVHRYLRSLT